MGYLKIRGVVIKEVNTGDADRIITIATAEQGKIQAIAKGARRARSKIGPGTKFLCYSEFTLFKSKSMYVVNACEVIESFYGLREDVERLTYSAHVVEIINDVIQENEPCPKVMQLILNTLYFLASKEKNPALVTAVFELRLMAITGYAPYVSGCMECGKSDPGIMAFSFNLCGFLCADARCIKRDPYSMRLLPGTVKAISHIVNSEMNKLFSFNLSGDVLKELGILCRKYMSDRLEKNYTKLDYLKCL